MTQPPANLFDDLPQQLPEEITQTLLNAGGIRIERIVSHGHASPADFWYDQAEHEWVLLLAGAAKLEFADGPPMALKPGSYVNLPAHRQHRVAWTDPNQPTIWLAIFYHG